MVYILTSHADTIKDTSCLKLPAPLLCEEEFGHRKTKNVKDQTHFFYSSGHVHSGAHTYFGLKCVWRKPRPKLSSMPSVDTGPSHLYILFEANLWAPCLLFTQEN